ncbi:MAG: lysylphosphatidylglycerol synthase transmembrane domain-containing protein [Candidatus Sumerlaeaceae bacterium]
MKRLAALAITVVILALLFWKVDQPKLWQNLRQTHWGWFAAAMLAFVPQVLVIAWRWKRLVDVFTQLKLGESVRLVLASQTMNLVLPSKMGDLSKGYFLSRRGLLDLTRAMNVVVFEKLLDVATLAGVMLLGVAALLASNGETDLQTRAALVAAVIGCAAVAGVAALYFVPTRYIPGFTRGLQWLDGKPKLRKLHTLAATGHDVIHMLQSHGARRAEIVAMSMLIWCLHLVQIYFFFRSLGAAAPLAQFATLVPLAIFIGLLPISIAGFGTRDAALIALFPGFPGEVMLGVAMYVNLRYILPAACGMPFLHKYMQSTTDAI